MNIVFFGTSEFAIPALRALLDSRHKVLAVVTQPDRKKGRQLKLSEPPVKALAVLKDIPVYQPLDVSSRESSEYLKKFNADLFVVVSFGQILKSEILSLPKLYPINIHGSLLPKYRGAAPTNRAIINGDRTSGVTVIKMNEKMDEGDIISSKEIKIDDEDTNITLSERLSELGAKALLDVIDMIEIGKATFSKQDESMATYAPKLSKKDGLIDWDEPSSGIHNKIRGFIPWPGAYTCFNGKVLKIWKTCLSDVKPDKSAKSGEVISLIKNKGIIVKTGLGCLAIEHLQLEGKKILDTDSFLRGHKMDEGYIFPGSL